ncbi:mitochondrial carrier [Chiua virens]|nr:mitochondrial carrier [Chiua virens]
MLNFTGTLLVVGLLAILFAILVPLIGALARFRAQYNPKGLQLDPEGDVQPHTGPVITSFFAMLVRVHRIEGWPGLYKGLMPTLLSTSMITVFALLWNDGNPRHGIYHTVSTNGLAYSLFTMLFFLPKLITARAITTPHKLPYFNAAYSLRILLTPTERRRPWILYLTPGLLATQVPLIACGLFFRIVWPLLRFPSKKGSIVELAILLVPVLAGTIVVTPLEVIFIRLAIQRNHAAPEFNSVSQEEDGDAEQAVEYSGANEDVIGLRTEREPYTGLIDCATRIIDEEGWSALCRAWWLPTLGYLTGLGFGIFRSKLGI